MNNGLHLLCWDCKAELPEGGYTVVCNPGLPLCQSTTEVCRSCMVKRDKAAASAEREFAAREVAE